MRNNLFLVFFVSFLLLVSYFAVKNFILAIQLGFLGFLGNKLFVALIFGVDIAIMFQPKPKNILKTILMAFLVSCAIALFVLR